VSGVTVRLRPGRARARYADEMVTAWDALGLLGAGVAAGVANAAAGGGTLVAYPALVAMGVPPVLANVTTTAGLLPGYAGSCLGYRKELTDARALALRLAPAGLLGGVLGAVILLVTPGAVFKQIVPVLVLLACALLALQPRLARLLKQRRGAAHGVVLPFAVTTACAVYGAYFGAGLGVVLLAALGIVLTVDLQTVNALKAAVSLLANAAGLAVFVIGTSVAWADAGLLAVGAFAGGRAGAEIARKLPAATLRTAVLVLGVVIGVILAVRTYS
jgi:uncharacterized protein